MSRHGIILMVLGIIAIAGWAYSTNYNTRTALDRVSELRAEISKERETLQVLMVEWAFLNSPDRLARLVEENNGTLGLAPVAPEAMGEVAAVPFVAPADEPEDLAVISGGGVPIPTVRPVGGPR